MDSKSPSQRKHQTKQIKSSYPSCFQYSILYPMSYILCSPDPTSYILSYPTPLSYPMSFIPIPLALNRSSFIFLSCPALSRTILSYLTSLPSCPTSYPIPCPVLSYPTSYPILFQIHSTSYILHFKFFLVTFGNSCILYQCFRELPATISQLCCRQPKCFAEDWLLPYRQVWYFLTLLLVWKVEESRVLKRWRVWFACKLPEDSRLRAIWRPS